MLVLKLDILARKVALLSCGLASLAGKFHFSSIETTASEKGYLRGEHIFNNLIYNKDLVLKWQVFQEAYKRFLKCLDYGQGYLCVKCPETLPEGDSEENYPNVVEVHTADAVMEGNEYNIKKGIPEDQLFGNKPPANLEVKKGVESKDRTFLGKKERDSLKILLSKRDKATPLKSLCTSWKKKAKNDNTNLILDIFIHLKDNCDATSIPAGYYFLLDELSRETPISALLPSQNKAAITMLMEYLTGKDTLFNDIDKISIIKREFPIIFQCMYDILEYEKQVLGHEDFLSEPVNNLFLGLLHFNEKFLALAEELDGAEPPKPTQPSPAAEIWPNHPTHTEEENFWAESPKSVTKNILRLDL